MNKLQTHIRHSPLAGIIPHKPLSGSRSTARTSINHATPFLLHESRKARSDAVENTKNIHIKAARLVGLGDLEGGLVLVGHTGVVDEDI